MEKKTNLSFKQMIILITVAIFIFVAFWNYKELLAVITRVCSYLIPVFVGGCIAFVINVPVKAFETLFAFIARKMNIKVKHTLNTVISLVLTMICLAGIIAIFAKVMAPSLVESSADIARKFKVWYPSAIALLKDYGVNTSYFESLGSFDTVKVVEWLKGYLSFATMGIIINAASSTVSVVLSALSCIFFSLYMIVGKRKLNRNARKLFFAYLPVKVAEKVCYVGSLFYKTFYNYISSQCLDALILALILYVALRIFSIPYAGVICILTGVLALIPYIGAISSCVIGTLLLLLVSPVKAVIFVVIFIVVQQLEGQLIYPHLVGSSVGLPAIWTLFAALIGGKMIGLFGIVFFIPLAAVFYTLIREGAVSRLEKKGIVVISPVDAEEEEKIEKHLQKQQLTKIKREEKRKLKADKKEKRRKN